MKRYKSLIVIIISLMILLVIAVCVYLYKNNKDATIPEDAKCIATIYQRKETTGHKASGDGDYYTYEFYPKSKNKCIVRKYQNLDVGVIDLYVKPNIVYTKMVKKSDISEIEQEIKNDINIYNKVNYTYYDNGNAITCNSLQELFEKLF